MRVLLKHHGGDPLPYLVGGIFEVVKEDEYYYYFDGFCWPKKFAETVDLDKLSAQRRQVEELGLLLSHLPVSKLDVKLTFQSFGSVVKEKVLDLSHEAMVRLRELVDEDLRKQLRGKRDELRSF